MKVKELKELFEGFIEELNNYDDEEVVKMVSNTYFLGHPKYFLGVAGYYDGGYINLDNFEEWIREEDE